MKIHEYNEMMAYLTRPATRQTVASGGRIGLALGTGEIANELKNFVEQFKLKNNRIPTQNEIIKGTGRASKTIKSYLAEGIDFAKPLTKSEAAKLGGDISGSKKITGVTKLNEKAYKELQDLRIKGVSFGVNTGAGGSKGVQLVIQNPEVRNAFLKGNKTKSVPANAKGIGQLKDLVEQIAVSDVYSDNVLPFQTDEYKRKISRLKEAQYKLKDPYGVYKKLSLYKSEIFPEGMAKKIQIQHGDAKFTAQTLGRMGLIDAAANISPAVEKAERLRNDALKKAMATLNNPNASVVAKKAAAEKYNSIAKGLRGQLKGTAGQGFVNFQLLEVDNSGKYKKLKDISFDPKKALVKSDLDLSKITKEQADELIAKGKKKLDLEAVKLKTGITTTADKIPIPEKTKTREMFQKAFNIGKTVSKPIVRAVAPFVPFLGPIGVGLGAADVAEAAEFTKKPDELGLAYLAGPDLARSYGEYKNRIRGMQDETEEFVP